MKFTCSPTENPIYADLVKQSDDILRRSRYITTQFPRWDSTEPAIDTINIGNHITADIAFDTSSRRNLRINGICPEGFVQQPASHLIEHMMGYPAGLDEWSFRSQSGEDLVRFNGTTGRDETTFDLSIHPYLLSEWQTTKMDPYAALVALMYGTVVKPDFSKEWVNREQERVTAEYLGREDESGYRLFDYIIPLAIGGKGHENPSISHQVDYSPDELVAIHLKRPHAEMRFEITGNPMSRNPYDAEKRIIDGIRNTFGQLTVVERAKTVPDNIYQAKPFPFGTRVNIVPHVPQNANYIGIASIVDFNSRPDIALAKKIASDTIYHYAWKKLSIDGNAYQPISFESSHDHGKRRINFTSGNTIALEKADKSLQEVLGSFDKKADSQLTRVFENARFDLVYKLFGDTGLGRVNLSRSLGFSTANNCSELFIALRGTDFDAVLDQGRQLLSEGRVGIIHYGSNKALTGTGFNEVTEKHLLRIRDKR